MFCTCCALVCVWLLMKATASDNSKPLLSSYGREGKAFGTRDSHYRYDNRIISFIILPSLASLPTRDCSSGLGAAELVPLRENQQSAEVELLALLAPSILLASLISPQCFLLRREVSYTSPCAQLSNIDPSPGQQATTGSLLFYPRHRV